MKEEEKKKTSGTRKTTKTTRKPRTTTKSTTRTSKPKVQQEVILEKEETNEIKPEPIIVQEAVNEDNNTLIIRKEIDDEKIEFNLIEVIVIVLITAVLFSATAGVIVYRNYYRINRNSVNPNNYNNSELYEFIDNYNRINNDYVEEVDKKGLIDAAIKGMYDYLNDGYSMYLSEDDTSSLEEQLSGEYTGIGIEIVSELVSEDKYVTKINRVFKNTPASRAGLKKDDILLKIDGVEIDNASTVADTIKKGNKESYEITYKRDDKEKTITVKREKVYIESVTSEVYDKTGYIKIDSFSSTTKEQVSKIINSFDKKIESLVIDVRDNTGGYLSSAYDTSDLFVEKGKVIYQLKDRDGNITKHKAEQGVLRKFKKIAVLINGGSASASEILALALKESSGAIIVGTKSYGKGTVQETRSLSSGAMVKYTTSYWLSPDGNSINKVGIKPDIEEKVSDNQLDKALKAVK